MKKKYYITHNVGTARYLVSFHDGIKKHRDGSDFYDIRIFHNKKDLKKFEKSLLKNNYIYSTTLNPCKYKRSAPHERADTRRRSKWYYIKKAKEKRLKKIRKISKNPVTRKTTKIYDCILSITAIKGKRLNLPGIRPIAPTEIFEHKFSRKSHASVYGLSDGSLLIKGNKPLWKVFDYK